MNEAIWRRVVTIPRMRESNLHQVSVLSGVQNGPAYAGVKPKLVKYSIQQNQRSRVCGSQTQRFNKPESKVSNGPAYAGVKPSTTQPTSERPERPACAEVKSIQ